MTIIELAAIVQINASGTNRRSRRVQPGTPSDPMMMHAINQEIGRGSVSNPDFTPHDRANVRDFSRRLFITTVHRRRGESQKSDFFPRIKNRVCSREKLVWCPPTPRVLHCFSCRTLSSSRARDFGPIGEIYSGRNGPGAHTMSHMLARCSERRHPSSSPFVPCKNANVPRRDTVHRLN